MIKLTRSGVYFRNGAFIPAQDGPAAGLPAPEEARKGTMAYRIMAAHNTSGDMASLKIKFDAITSHDITYVGICLLYTSVSNRAFLATSYWSAKYCSKLCRWFSIKLLSPSSTASSSPAAGITAAMP